MSNFVSLDNRSLMLDHGLDVISGRFLFYLVAAFTLSVGIPESPLRFLKR